MKNFPPLTAVMALAFMAPAHAQTPPPPPMQHIVSVSGEAEGEFAPDQAVVTLSLVSRNKELKAAKEHNDRLTEKLVAITQSHKISKERITPSGLSISPDYSYEHNKQQLIGYVVNRTLRITVDDLTIPEQLLSAAVEAGVDQVSGVEYRLGKPEDHAQKLRASAYENAKARAGVLAGAAGVKLGKPLAIALGGASGFPQPQPMHAMGLLRAKEASSVAPSLPGLIKLQESVSVTFALE